MRQFKLFLTLLMLMCFGVGQMWGAELTYTHAFTTKPSSGDNTLSTITWTTSNINNLNNYNSGYAGVQVGTSSSTGSITFTSKSNWGAQASTTYFGYTKVKYVYVWLNNGSGSISATVTIGGKTATKSGTVSKNTNASSDYTKTSKITYTPASDGTTGQIVIAVSTSSKAGYVAAIEVVCEQPASCSNKVTLEKGSTANGTFDLDQEDGTYDNCDANFVVHVSNITPTSAAYYCTGVTATGENSSVTGPDGSGNYTVTYAKGNNITSTITANFEAKTARTVTFMNNGVQYGDVRNLYDGDAVGALPSGPSSCATGKTFVGWSATEIGVTPTDVEPTFITASTIVSGSNKVYHAVFATATQGEDEVLSQTLLYDTWSYSGTTTDKTSYRLFGNNAYVESASFDLSTLSKVIVYGGTFGGDSYNSLTIGDGTNTWKSVTVSGKSETGTNTYTGGTALSGTGTLRIKSNSGNGSSSGVRISQVKIYTIPYEYSGYITGCCTELGSIKGSVSLSQLTSGGNTGKLQASWPSQTTTAGWADNGIKIKFYKVGSSNDTTLVHTSDALANSTTAYTWGTAPDKCATYFARFVAVHGSDDSYCAGDVEGGESNDVTTAGYSVNVTGVTNVTPASEFPSTTCASGFSIASMTGATGYDLPSSITVTGASHTWNSSTGALTISSVTGDVTITIAGQKKECTPMDAVEVETPTVTYNGASLSWGSVDHATKYKVYIKTSADVVIESDENISTSSRTYTVSAELEHSTTYKYSIVAVSEDEDTYCSSTKNGTFTTEDYPTVKLFYSENGVLSDGVDKKILTDITLDEPATDPCTKKFVGWSTVTVAETNTAPTMIQPGDKYQIPTNANCTLYAVYATETPGSATLTRMATGNTLAANDKIVIVAKDEKVALYQETTNTSYVKKWTFTGTDPVVSDLDDDKKLLDVSAGNDGKWILGDATNGYLYDASSNKLYVGNTQGEWTLGDNEDGSFTLTGGNQKLSYRNDITTGDNAYLWRGGNNNGVREFYIYKYATSSPTYSAYATTCAGKVATPTFTGVVDNTTYEENKTVGLNCGTEGATIRYTMSSNGEAPADPTGESTSATSITLENNGTYIIKAKAFKTNMDASDVAAITVTIDKPYTTIASFIAAAPENDKKLVLAAENNAVILGVNSSRIYIQDNTAAIYLYKYNHGLTWAKGKKVVGTIIGSYELNNNTPRMKVSEFVEGIAATADGEMPSAVTIEGTINETNFAANRNKLVTVSGLNFGVQSVADGATINITSGDDTYQLYNAFNALTGHILPLSTTACSVTGIMGYYNEKYQLMPIEAACITTGATAVLPTLAGEVGGADSEHATSVPSGEQITLTAETGYTTTYKIGEGAATAVSTSGTNVTITGDNNAEVVITVSASREYYANNSRVYYYKIDNSLIRYNIDKATATNGSFVVKNSDSNEITSSVSGATITLAATPQSNEDGRYHFGSWTIRNANNDDVTASVSISSTTNKDATFVMPAYGVKVSATFAEDAYATVTFVKGADAASGTVNSQKVYVGQNATMPANSFSYAGHSFAGWELNSTTYQPGETYLVTAAGDIEFAAKWREKDINKDGQWELVTNANQLNAGDYVVIAQNAQGKTESATIGGNSNKYLTGVATTFSGDNNEYITKTNLNASTVKYVLGGTSGAWVLTDDATGKELSINNSDNPSWVEEDGSTWNIAIENGNTCIYLGNSTTKRVMFNTSGGFRPYTTGPTASMLYPQIYKFYRTAFVVSYDANGGEGAPDPQRADPDNNQVTISSTVPTREGYDFAGWEDGDGNAKSGTITLTENTTLFAQWTPTPYNAAVESVDNITITATPEGESAIAEGSNANVPYGTTVTLSYSNVASSHIFNGWNVTKADDAETVVTVTSNTFTMPAYAVKIAASVDAKASVVLTVTYEANGGEGTMEGNPFEFTFEQEVTAAANPFTKANFTFRGWQDQDENVYKPGDKFNIEKNMTLTAIWRANGAMYTITGTSAVSSSTGVPEGSTATYSQTYTGAAGQMTADKSTTLTLTGYANKIIKKAIFSMKTNKNGGAGSIKMTIGANTVIDYSADDFGTWFGSNTDSYKDVEVTIPDVLVNTNENIVVTMSASANSMYVRSYTFDYANAEVYSGTTSIPAGEKEAIVVKDGGNVTISGDVTSESIIVEDGGKVTLEADVNADVFHIAASKTEGEANSSGQVIVNANNLHISGEAYFDYTLDPSGTATYGYYAFCVPFPVNSSTGIYTTSDVKLDDGVDYVLYNYHGEIRATGNYGWKRFNGTLTPGVFYLISLYADENNECAYNTIRFKMEARPEGYDCKGASATIQYNEYAQTSGNTNDAGWNGVGNPTVQYVKADVDDSENNTKYHNTLQVYNHTANTFGPATTGVNAFTVGSPFFMQAKTTDYMSFTDGNGAISSNILAPARVNAQTIERICVSFGNEVYTDRMYIAASEDALNSYELCRDLSKMSIGTARVAQISSYNYGLNLMVEYAPLTNNQATYQLNLFAPAAGTYSLSAQEVEGATLYVTYNGAIVWNLSLGDYEIDLARGTTTGYGLLLVAQPNQMPTGVDTSEGVGGDAVQKILLNGQLYILRDGHLFDAVGKEVK